MLILPELCCKCTVGKGFGDGNWYSYSVFLLKGNILFPTVCYLALSGFISKLFLFCFFIFFLNNILHVFCGISVP